MTGRLDKLAWFGAALAVMAWAFVPRIAWADTVLLPQLPVITTTILPPRGPDRSEAEGILPDPPRRQGRKVD